MARISMPMKFWLLI